MALPAAAGIAGLLVAAGSQGGVLPAALLAPGLLVAAAAVVALAWAAARRDRHEARRLRALLEEERDMLREMQHRNANALQFLASLLSLEAERVTDEDAAREALEDAAARLGTVARIHRRLHDPRLSGAVLPDLLRDIAAATLGARGIAVGEGVALTVELAPAARSLDTARATAVAMIVAEAATNAAKHAFAASGRGRLRIAIEPDGADLVLTVADDGPGPPGGPPTADSLGLTVMQTMAARLGGAFGFGPGDGGGARVRVAFPAAPPAGARD